MTRGSNGPKSAVCASCGAPVGDARLCHRCAARLADDLGDIPALAEALVVSYTRQGRMTTWASRSTIRPLPYDPRASDAATALRTSLTGWVRILDLEDAPRTGNARQLAAWLLARLERIRHHAAADEIATDIAMTVAQARRAVDRPPELWFAGPCDGCHADLYAHPQAAAVKCHKCGLRYEVTARRRWLLAAAEDHLATATEVARALSSWLGTPVTAQRIYTWRDRGRLTVHGLTLDGSPTYRVGDVLDLLTAEASRRTA